MDLFWRSLLLLIFFHSFDYSSTSKSSIPHDKCSMCSIITDKFLQGISRTSKSNFGGGNTRWEEDNLGRYVFSETRFIEIVEKICIDENKECHQMLEAHEELLENWWKKFYAQRIESDLKEYLCVRRLKVCCARGTYGPDCKDCKGGRNGPCNRNGRCDGDGTKKGSGECNCDVGYEGILCHTCTDGFYDNNPEVVRSEALERPLSYRPTCIPCHASCKSKCKGQGPEGCHACKDGWIMMDDVGCTDLNECEDESMCPWSEYCINTDGSYKCNACHKACGSCTGKEVSDCITCSVRHFRNMNNTCTACHESCARSCENESPGSCDQCRKGWKVDENGVCQDLNECQAAEMQLRCSEDEYCVNAVGSYKCSTCHPNCNGCHGAGIDKCSECREGYRKSDEGSCVDVDECQVPDEACPGTNKKCINLPGGYRCDCSPGFRMLGGLCVHSSHAGSSNQERGESSHGSVPTNQKRNSNEAKKIKKQKKVPLYKRDLPQYLMRLAGFTVACSITKQKLLLQSAVTLAFASYLYYYASELDGSYVRG